MNDINRLFQTYTHKKLPREQRPPRKRTDAARRDSEAKIS